MAKDKGHHRPEAIPLPETVKDALSRPSKNAPYVSHSVKAEGGRESVEKSELTSNNHAFYVGKMMPYSFDEKIQKLFGWSGADGRIYTPEVIKGLLDYAFRNLKDGEKLRFVIVPSFSELFNGSDDVERALSPEKEIELIQKIAKKEFGLGAKPLEIVDMEQEPLNRDLFEQLRSSIDSETKVVDPKKAFETNGRIELGENSSSLQIAQLLYRVSEEDERLAMAFEHAVPGRFKESENTQYYALTEVAVRLAEILKGRIIHGGAERQEVYDRIIAKIIKGKEGSYKNIKALEPLFKLFEGKRFETIHLKTRENYYELKRKRNLARCRMLLTMVLGGGAVLGIYNYGKHVEREESEIRQKLIDSKIYEGLKDITLYYHGPFMERSKEDNVDAFHEVVRGMQEDVIHRYQVSEEVVDKLKPFIQDFLLRNKVKLSSAEDSGFNRIDLTDIFVKEQVLFFENEGIEILRPHQGLIPNIPAFRGLLSSNEDLFVDDGKKNSTSNERGLESQEMEFEHIGTFYSGEANWGDNNKYEFYWCHKEDGKRHLVAKDGKTTCSHFIGAGPASHDAIEECNRYSTRRAKEGVKQFFYSMKRFDAIGLSEYQSLLYDLHNRRDYEESKDVLCQGLSKDAEEAELMRFDRNDYRDFLGEFYYEFIIESDFDEDTLATKKCLLARKQGESEFTDKRAHEMTVRYFQLIEDSYRYSHGEYPDFSKPDIKYVSVKLVVAKRLVRQVENKLSCVEDFYGLSFLLKRFEENIKELEEALKNYDESDSSNRKINELMIELEEIQESYLEEIQEYDWSCAEVIENLNEILQTRDKIMNATWAEQEKKSVE